MKKIVWCFLAFAFPFMGVAADGNLGSEYRYELTCYQKYVEAFERRGATGVKDGTYKDVIVTLRKGSMADCFYGKVTVKNGEIDVREIYLMFEDGTHEKIVRKYRYPDQSITIDNGMSKTMVTVDEELINVLFVENIKPKKKAYSRAPDPDF